MDGCWLRCFYFILSPAHRLNETLPACIAYIYSMIEFRNVLREMIKWTQMADKCMCADVTRGTIFLDY